MYKLVAIDIDGTLLTDSKVLLPDVKEALEEAANKGVIVLLCSGRSPVSLGSVKDLFDFDMPFACYNGGLVIKGKSNEVLYESPVKSEDAKLFYEEGKKRGVTINMWTSDGILCQSGSEEGKAYYKKIAKYKKDTIDLDKHPEMFSEKIAKILWQADPELIENKLIHEAREIVKNTNSECATSRPELLEFIDLDGNKSSAMNSICKKYNIKHEETMAIGDGRNDISMIEWAKMGVAMENATDEVKSYANYIAPSNNDSGVGYVFRKFILGEK